jgi:hypothetical protein
MSTMRYRYERRAGRATPRLDPRLPVLAVVTVVVFGCYFAIGRLAESGSSRSGAHSSLPALFHSGATPIGLSGAPPIAAVVSAPRPVIASSNRSISTRAASAHRQPIAREVSHHEVSRAPLQRSSQVEQPVSSSSPSPAKAPSPPASTPAPSAPAPSTPSAPSAPSTGGSSSGGGGSHSGSSQGGGGGSFDSSG